MIHRLAPLAALLIACGAAPEPDLSTPTPQETPAVQLPDIDALWNFGDPAATEAAFRTAQAEAGDDAPLGWRLELQTQIARTQGLQRQFDAGHDTLDSIAPHITDAPPVVEVRALLERGRLFNSAGDKAKARPLFVKAWDHAREIGADGYAVDAAHMVAIVEAPAEALAWNQKALAFAEASSDPKARKWMGALYNNIGWTHHEAGRFTEALAVFEKGLAFREAAGKARPTRIAKWSIARTLRSLDRPKDALVILEALEAEWRAAGGEDGFVYEELGEVHLMLGNTEAAKGWFARAYPLLAKIRWVAEGHADRLARVQTLGGF